MKYQTTNQLFKNKYQYKVVITCAGAGVFRGQDLDSVLERLKQTNLTRNRTLGFKVLIKEQEDLDYAFQLHNVLTKLSDIEVRVESPWVTVYTNDKSAVNKITKLDESKIKYISVPPTGQSLEEGTIILPKINYDYKVTIGKTTVEHSAFILWAETNPKIKLTKTCKRELARTLSWGGTYFYITGENNLLMAKMHLGGAISKIERIVKG